MKFNAPEVLLRLWPALEHRGEGNVQGFADLEQASRAHAVRSLFVLLYLLERDAQFFA